MRLLIFLFYGIVLFCSIALPGIWKHIDESFFGTAEYQFAFMILSLWYIRDQLIFVKNMKGSDSERSTQDIMMGCIPLVFIIIAIGLKLYMVFHKNNSQIMSTDLWYIGIGIFMFYLDVGLIGTLQNKNQALSSQLSPEK